MASNKIPELNQYEESFCTEQNILSCSNAAQPAGGRRRSKRKCNETKAGACSRKRTDNMKSWTIGSTTQSSYHYGHDEGYLSLGGLNHDHCLFGESEEQGYFDFGDMDFTCAYCGAMFWYEERSQKSTHSISPQFSLCCMKRKVVLPLLNKPPSLIWDLFNGVEKRSKVFIENIRAFNSMFAFTSIGAKIEKNFNHGNGPPNFVISGQNYHRIGSLVPIEGEQPKFAQLYIYDTQNEVKNRITHFSGIEDSSKIESNLIQDLMNMIDQHNVLAKSFRKVRDEVQQHGAENVYMRLFRSRVNDPRTYNLPTIDEVAAVIVGDFDSSDCGRDVLVRGRDGQFQRIHETHTSFIPLQYPLLFPYGEDGYQENIKYRANDVEHDPKKRKRVSLREFIAFRLHERKEELSLILKGRRLLQQYVVDCYSMIESQRLSYIWSNQQNIRKDFLCGLQEAVDRGDVNPSTVGSRIVLPSSFVGGKRYMFNNCQDAMAICKHYGYPDLFLTVTCNPKWKEIKRFCDDRGLNAYDRPDITCHVFRIKLDQLMTDLKKGQFFGEVNAGMYTIEFQKRGLPHAHILIWLSAKDKLNSVEVIDSVICAELPNPSKFPKLFEVVSSYMVHGPCGINRKESPCMKDSKCSKYFPKKFVAHTSFDSEGYPTYRRRNTGVTTLRHGVDLDNHFVVPYNPRLLMKYQAHINIEYYNKGNSIKYLFKYINKGVDKVTLSMSFEEGSSSIQQPIDEIKQYYDCRYLSPCESVWRTFAFDIHHHWPPVTRLTFHLPGQQIILFKDDEAIDNVVHLHQDKQTMFLAWMEANTIYVEGQSLTYSEFPSMFVYDAAVAKWHLRKRGFAIGRMNFIPIGSGEVYYLRLLLNVQKGCTSYEDLRTINDITYPTFEEACSGLGLLTDDREYIDGIIEASAIVSGVSLRRLFVNLLLTNSMSKPLSVWNETWELLADGIIYEKKKTLNCTDLKIDGQHLKMLCLVEIEKMLMANGKSLKDFESMSYPNETYLHQFGNILIFNELNFDVNEMFQKHQEHFPHLNNDQKIVYNQVLDAIHGDNGGFFFVYGYGGTGKTFLWKTLTYQLRSEKKIVLNVASSGIASLLLPGGRTAHSQFSIPLHLTEEACCNIKQGSQKAELLKHTSLIIWDEAPMVSKLAFEALDRTMRDVMRFSVADSKDKPFGGKVVVLGGDFRQILPVVPKGSRAEIVMATINSSRLWKHCKVFTLNQNMRLMKCCNDQVASEINMFANWILDVGDGKVGDYNDGESTIEIPTELLLINDHDPIGEIVASTYPNLVQHFGCANFFKDKAILAPTLEIVQTINDYVMSIIPGEEKVYFSSDSICSVENDEGIESNWMNTEFLNDIKCSGIPDHKLVLKKGVPVMLMRNLDISVGLCNGTRMIVDQMGGNVISGTIVTGSHAGNKVFIPRMNLIPSGNLTPVKFQRRQFPLVVCFAMTINKSQGQTLSHVGVFLSKPVFSHGQLYVVISRVKSRDGLKILIPDENTIESTKTKNIVYKEVFQKL